MKRGGQPSHYLTSLTLLRPLGSGLLIQPFGQRVLADLGLPEKISALAALVTHLLGINVQNGKRALDIEFCHLGEGVGALGIHCASLFVTLFDAVAAEGIKTEAGCRLVSADVGPDYVEPLCENGRSSGRFDLLIDATGGHGPLAQGRLTQLPYSALWTTVDMPANTAIAGVSHRLHLALHQPATGTGCKYCVD